MFLVRYLGCNHAISFTLKNESLTSYLLSHLFQLPLHGIGFFHRRKKPAQKLFLIQSRHTVAEPVTEKVKTVVIQDFTTI